MPVWILRLTSLALALALSGSPAAFAACMASCLAPAATTASAGPAPSSHQDHRPSASTAADDVSHAHHGDSSAVGSAASNHHASASVVVTSRVRATCGDCCPDTTRLLAAHLRSERVSAASLVAASPTTLVTPFHRLVGSRPFARPSSPISPPTPIRATVPLRI